MPAPSNATYSVAAQIAAHTAFRDLLDAGGLAGAVQIKDDDDVLLAEIPLTYPCGTVDALTGQLTITPDGRDEEADASGTAAYAEFCDSDGVVHLSLPARQGSDSRPAYITLNTLMLIEGGPVELVSVTVGW